MTTLREVPWHTMAGHQTILRHCLDRCVPGGECPHPDKCPPAKRPMTEQQLHRQVADFLNVALKPEVWWTTFPAGGGARSWQNLQGLKRGVPDILIIAPVRQIIWIELKTARGRTSAHQDSAASQLILTGCIVTTCRSLDEVADLLGALDLLKDNVSLA